MVKEGNKRAVNRISTNASIVADAARSLFEEQPRIKASGAYQP